MPGVAQLLRRVPGSAADGPAHPGGRGSGHLGVLAPSGAEGHARGGCRRRRRLAAPGDDRRAGRRDRAPGGGAPPGAHGRLRRRGDVVRWCRASRSSGRSASPPRATRRAPSTSASASLPDSVAADALTVDVLACPQRWQGETCPGDRRELGGRRPPLDQAFLPVHSRRHPRVRRRPPPVPRCGCRSGRPSNRDDQNVKATLKVAAWGGGEVVSAESDGDGGKRRSGHGLAYTGSDGIAATLALAGVSIGTGLVVARLAGGRRRETEQGGSAVRRGLRYLPAPRRGRRRFGLLGLGVLAAMSLVWQQQATLASFDRRRTRQGHLHRGHPVRDHPRLHHLSGNGDRHVDRSRPAPGWPRTTC